MLRVRETDNGEMGLAKPRKAEQSNVKQNS